MGAITLFTWEKDTIINKKTKDTPGTHWHCDKKRVGREINRIAGERNITCNLWARSNHEINICKIETRVGQALLQMKGRMRQWNIPSRLIFQNPSVLSLELVPFIFVLTLFAFVISNVNHTEIMVHGCTSYHWVMDSCSFVRASCSYISAQHLKTLRLPKHSLVLTLDVRESESN